MGGFTYDFWSVDGRAHPDESDFEHFVFLDGTMQKTGCGLISRAAWALVDLERNSSTPRAVLKGPCSQELKQSPCIAECCAYAAACELAGRGGGSHLVVDSEPLVDLHEHPAAAVKASFVGGGIMGSALLEPAHAKIQAVTWVRPHQSLAQVSGGETFFVLGNQLADTAAKQAAALQPAWFESTWQEAEDYVQRFVDLCMLVARSLALWLQVNSNHGRPHGQQHEPRVSKRRLPRNGLRVMQPQASHLMLWCHGVWRCFCCLIKSRHVADNSTRRGHSPLMREVVSTITHVLFCAEYEDGSAVLLFVHEVSGLVC